MSVSLLAALLLASAQPPSGTRWSGYEGVPGAYAELRKTEMIETIVVSIWPSGRSANNAVIWTAIYRGFVMDRRFWTDSVQCVALTKVIDSFSHIPPVQPNEDEVFAPDDRRPPPPLDGTRYQVRLGTSDLGSRVELWQEGDANPVANWADRVFDALNACWVEGSPPTR